MRFKRHLQLEHGLNIMYIVPLVNVVLLLLIFFLLISNLVTGSGIKVGLPRALESSLVKNEKIILRVAQDNKVYLNNQAVALVELKTVLKQLAPRNPNVIISSDKRASFEAITQIWEACRSLGILQISLTVE